MNLLSDAETFKSAALAQWEDAAPGWNAHTEQIRAWLRPATDAMLSMAGVRAGARVLDVAAGAGEQTLDIARRVGPSGAVLAADFSPRILAYAKANAAHAGYTNVQTLVGDAEQLELPATSFDAAVCRLGLMLLQDPLRALRAMHSSLKPGAGACVMVFSVPQANPSVATLIGIALEHAGLPPRDPFQPGSLFSLGKPGALDELFRTAGFADVATTKLQAPFHLPSARAYLEFVRTSASPVQQILSGLDPVRRGAAWAAMEERLKKFETAAGWEGPNELLLTAGRGSHQR
jgi:SAM-dependent methyltransferase